MEKSGSSMYPALRLIAGWFKIVGYVVTAAFVISGLVAAAKDGLSSVFFGFTIGGLFAFAFFVSIAEIIQLLLDSERNTRDSAHYLKKLVELQSGERGSDGDSLRTIPVQPASPEPEKRPSSAIKRKPTPARTRPAPVPITPAQAESIRKLVRHLHADGLSLSEIVKELAFEGIQALDGTGRWSEEAVQEVLSSESS